jgi:hypothetical protein
MHSSLGLRAQPQGQVPGTSLGACGDPPVATKVPVYEAVSRPASTWEARPSLHVAGLTWERRAVSAPRST